MKNKKDKTLYSDDSIISLSPREFTRLRPSTYLGSNEYSTQLMKEVFSNSLDEHIIGHGDKITVTIDTADNSYTVSDNGQGFPINVIREDNETVLQASFDVLNTSGKYDDGGIYQGASLGLNGIGSKLTNFLSKSLSVYSSNGNNYEFITFKDGIFESRQTGEKQEPSGTSVSWIPDAQFFQNPQANVHDLEKLFEDISALCPELTIVLVVDGKEKVFHSENGIQDLLDKKTQGKELLSSRFNIRKISGSNLFDISMTYTTDYSDSVTAYVNYGLTESGIHISTVKSLMTKQINKYAEDNGLLKKNDEPLTSAELAEGLVIVFNLKAGNVKYDSQTKVRVVDIDRTFINNVMRNDFPIWLKENQKDAKLIIDRALNSRKAREAAQNARDRIRNASNKGKKFINLPTKLVDAYTKNRSEAELFITEGDSAANGLIAKRDGKTQAIFPIRGKILSCRKATPDKVYANQEIANLVKALGLDVDKSTGKLIYDKRKLRYDKIILATDADADGYDIRLLLLNAFWWLCEDLVTAGHIHVAIPPLYRITTKTNEYIYLKGDKELNEYKKHHKNESYILSRNKGLGESSPEELASYLLRPATRNVEQITVDDSKATDDMLEMFMGPKVEPRRDYLLNHANEISVEIE